MREHRGKKFTGKKRRFIRDPHPRMAPSGTLDECPPAI